MTPPLQNLEYALAFSYLLWFMLLLALVKILASARASSIFIPISIGLIAFCSTPWRASDLHIVPDSVEYVSGAINLLFHGSYSVVVDGILHPPRYAPWFSLLLMPAYEVLGSESGNGIFVVLIFALLGVASAWCIGIEISGVLGAFISLLLLLISSEYSLFAREIMGDLPTAALLMVAGYGFIRMSRHGQYNLALPIGIVCGVACALRPLMVFALLPVVTHLLRNKRWLMLLLSVLPSTIFLFATLLYNKIVFGELFRSGYNYWTGVPYDYRSLVWAVDYISENLSVIFYHTSIPVLLVLTIFVVSWVRKDRSMRPDFSLLTFVAPIVISLISAHLLYFFGSSRFYLGAVSLLSITLGAYSGLLFQKLEARGLRIKQVLFVLVLLLAINFQFALRREPVRRKAAERIRDNTPTNSVIISGIDSVYLSLLLPERHIIAISRRVEYASKVVSLQSLVGKLTMPLAWHEHRADGIIAAGAKRAVAITALDNISEINEMLLAGQSVFVDSSFISEQELTLLGKVYLLSDVTDLLLRVNIRDSLVTK